MIKLLESLERVSFWQWLIGSLVLVGLIFYRFIRHLVLFAKRENNFQRNLDRPVMIVKPTDCEIHDNEAKFKVPMNMDREIELLKKSRLFKIEGPITADTLSTKIKDHGLVVLGYCEGMDSFQDVLTAVKSKQIPIIIYTFGCNTQASKDLDEVKKYPWHTFPNFPVRLVSEVYSILSTFQHDKNSRK